MRNMGPIFTHLKNQDSLSTPSNSQMHIPIPNLPKLIIDAYSPSFTTPCFSPKPFDLLSSLNRFLFNFPGPKRIFRSDVSNNLKPQETRLYFVVCLHNCYMRDFETKTCLVYMHMERTQSWVMKIIQVDTK